MLPPSFLIHIPFFSLHSAQLLTKWHSKRPLGSAVLSRAILLMEKRRV